ncbi:MAG: hypothetical protein AB1465_05910 [Patescibacteria group bacterium]
MSYNLGSKNNIKAPLIRKNLSDWFKNEVSDLEPHLQEITLKIFSDINFLCNFSEKALLLWASCDRRPPSKGKQKYHSFPEIIKQQAKQKGIYLDSRPNGPAVAAFEFAGGERPQRHGSNNKWHIHHLYSGKFPYIKKEETIHAAKDCLHFTQAAGLVALHPLADALADECPAFTWFLRYKVYEKFGYDPDQAFSEKIDKWGFDKSRKIELEIISK